MRNGVSLLELIIAIAITALIVTAAVTTIRGSVDVWDTYDVDSVKLDSAHATALHLVRQLRQCSTVSAISTPGDSTGSVTATNAAGQTIVWSLVGSNVMFGVTSPTDLLSTGIDSLNFTGYEADGTATTTVDDIRSVEFAIAIQLDRTGEPNRTIRSRVWLRAW